MLERLVQTVKENAEALVVATKEIGLEVNADKTKYLVMSRELNIGRSHNIKTDNSSFERVEEFKYLGTNLTDHQSRGHSPWKRKEYWQYLKEKSCEKYMDQ